MAIEDMGAGRDEWVAIGVCSLGTGLGLFMSSGEKEIGLRGKS